jgi:hypothetical protein
VLDDELTNLRKELTGQATMDKDCSNLLQSSAKLEELLDSVIPGIKVHTLLEYTVMVISLIRSISGLVKILRSGFGTSQMTSEHRDSQGWGG